MDHDKAAGPNSVKGKHNDAPAQRDNLAGGILHFARQFNGALCRIFVTYGRNEEMAAQINETLGYYGEKVGRLLWRHHWRRADGSRIKQMPFELHMAGVMLLSIAWVFDIFSRKARDRRSPHMANELEMLRTALNNVIALVGKEVSGHKAEHAFRQYVNDLIGFNQVAELQRLGLLPAMPWWRARWYRVFGIPRKKVMW